MLATGKHMGELFNVTPAVGGLQIHNGEEASRDVRVS